MTDELAPWKVLRTQDVLDCSPWFRVVADDVQLPDGQLVQGYYRIETMDFVMIFPLADRLSLPRSRVFANTILFGDE